MSGKITLLIASLSVCLLPLPAPGAEEAHRPWPVISIIIDDLGYRKQDDTRALALPGPIAFAIIPQSPFATKMSGLASAKGKTVLMHLPMEAVEEEKNRFLGPGGLTLNMTQEEFLHTMDLNLLSVPDAIGVNNHMGSLLTQHPGHMQWLMERLSQQHKFYIDSYTTTLSVADTLAGENNVPYLRRDVFLDNNQDEAYVRKQFKRLIDIARRRGKAIGIGHPHPVTVKVLAAELLRLDEYGVTLINLTELVDAETHIHPQAPHTITAGVCEPNMNPAESKVSC